MSARPELAKIECAAADDLVALRNLARDAYDGFLACSGNSEGAGTALTRAVTFARLAATHGRQRETETFMILLCRLAEWQRTEGGGTSALAWKPPR